MAEDTVVELSRDGTEAKVIFAKDIQIKDLWHIGMGIKNGAFKDWSQKDRDEASEAIIDTWSLAHHLKNHILDRG